MGKIADRFDKYMSFKGLNDNKVTVQLGLSIGLLGKSRLIGHDIGKKAIEKILNFYTDINETWLVLGEGEMIKAEPNGTEAECIKTSKMTEDEKFSVLMTLIEQHGDLIRQNGQLIEQNKMLIQHTMDLSETNSKQTSLLESIMKSHPSSDVDGGNLNP